LDSPGASPVERLIAPSLAFLFLLLLPGSWTRLVAIPDSGSSRFGSDTGTRQPVPSRRSIRPLRQASPAGADLLSTAKRLYAEEHWDELVRLGPVSPDQPAELDYYRGMALARLERWEEARAAFESGRRKEPFDKRFPLELAGVAFKRKNFARAKAELRKALRLDPGDRYALDFLATVYFLEANLDAALEYWNRIQKPQIEEIKIDPRPRLDPILFDRAFTFSPASVLELADLRTTEARIDALGIFPRYKFELSGRDDEKFDLAFRSKERNGWGSSKAAGLISLLRGVPYETVYPEWYNLRHSAINFESLLRWDAQKRRAFAALSGPLGRDPRLRYRVYLDGRNENWDISTTFFGSASPVTNLKLEKLEAGAEIQSVESWRWSWKTGADLSRRRFGNFSSANSQAAAFFTEGLALKYDAGLDAHVLRDPARRLTVDSGASAQLGKMLARGADPFAKIEGSLGAHWLPQARGDDYETSAQFRAGKTFGQPPFDELFILGLERDNDLGLRAHVGTRDGRKGAAPLGQNYVLFNSSIDKKVYENGFLELKLGPFLDSGKIYDPSKDFGSRTWLSDTGGLVKLRLPVGASIVFTYGKDLRSGHNAFYLTVSRN
jgi:tetratricopeptide (TPR) repeat protein